MCYHYLTEFPSVTVGDLKGMLIFFRVAYIELSFGFVTKTLFITHQFFDDCCTVHSVPEASSLCMWMQFEQLTPRGQKDIPSHTTLY